MYEAVTISSAQPDCTGERPVVYKVGVNGSSYRRGVSSVRTVKPAGLLGFPDVMDEEEKVHQRPFSYLM